MSLAGVSLLLSIGGLGCSPVSSHTMGFWYDRDAFVLAPAAASRLGGQIDAAEKDAITQSSRAEVERAFSGLRIALTEDDKAFWRVKVVKSLPARPKRQLPAAGESLALGVLGGVGYVGVDFVAAKAVDYAPPHAARPVVIAAIGRGIGRVAVHEFLHQILGPAFPDDYTDDGTYEYGRPDRPSQYYGELRWGSAWPLLRERLGLIPPKPSG